MTMDMTRTNRFALLAGSARPSETGKQQANEIAGEFVVSVRGLGFGKALLPLTDPIQLISVQANQELETEMLKNALAVAAVALGASVVAAAPASAMPGYAAPRLEIKAGPDDDYPTVATVRYDSPLEINGCLRNWSWCDVTTRRGRGWVHGRNIQAQREGRRVEFGAPWGVPQFSFNFDTYWDKNYRGQQFYRDRDRWERHDHDDPDGNDNDPRDAGPRGGDPRGWEPRDGGQRDWDNSRPDR